MLDQKILDWPFFEDHHRRLAHNLEAWCIRNIASGYFPIAPAGESGKHETVAEVDRASRELVEQLASAGWLDWSVPGTTDDGNQRLDVRALCLIRETLARHRGLADFAFAMQGLGSGAISLFGSRQQCEQYLPSVKCGSSIAGFALTEPDAGSDVANLQTRAERTDQGYLVNGSKTWISNGGIADFYTIFARTGQGEGRDGLSAFILDADTPGLKITERLETLAPHPLASLEFQDVLIPINKLLGKPGDGFQIAMSTLDVFRPTVGAAALGFARRALDEALARTTKRRLYGQTMDRLPLVKAKIGEMALQIDSTALLVYRAGWVHDCIGGRTTREASMAKLYATETAQQVIDSAVQLFGGQGVRSGTPVEELYREIRALRIYEGASEVHQLIIGGQTISDFQNKPQPETGVQS